MPLFETPKPKQFHYKPRFYDPEKERWEALKQKYAEKKMLASDEFSSPLPTDGDEPSSAEVNGEALHTSANVGAEDRDLEYFQRRVREIDRKKRSKLTWKDMFRRREMPQFHYQPRFIDGADTEKVSTGGTAEHLSDFKRRGIKIKRRFGDDDPKDNTLKPIPAGRIMLYALLVTLLIYWIIM